MDPKGKDDIASEVFLTTNPKIIMRKREPVRDQYVVLFRLLAAICGAGLALFLISKFKQIF